MSQRGVRWLYEELPGLVETGVLSQDTADRLRGHYGTPAPVFRQGLALALFGALGALCIGLGIILIFAHNWEQLGRPVRLFLSFAPLLAGQGLVLYTLLRRSDSAAWREASGAFLTIAIGACIALVSQTYHIEGKLRDFMLTWVLLAAPLVFLTNTVSVMSLYALGVLLWAGSFNWSWARQENSFFWVLMLPAFWFVWRAGMRREWIRLRLALPPLLLALTVGTGFAALNTWPGLWMVSYAALVTGLWLAHRLFLGDCRWTPLSWAPQVGMVALCVAMSYDDFWGGATRSWVHGRDLQGIYVNTLVNAVPIALVIARAMMLAGRNARRFSPGDWFIVCLPFLVLAMRLFMETGQTSELPAVAFNLFLLALGLTQVWAGLRSLGLMDLNFGLAVLCALLTARFFDTGLSFLMRGVLFMALGAVFIGANVWLVTRKRQPGGAAE
jgi:hypothetical protein